MPEDISIQLANASPETRAAFEGTLAKYGVVAPAPSTPNHTPANSAPIVRPPEYNNADYGLKPTELDVAAENLRKYWTGSPEELERALSANGAKSSASPVAFNPTLDPPLTPNEYKIRYQSDAISGLSPSEVAAMDSLARNAFHAAGMPMANADGLMAAILKATAAFKEMTDDQRKLAFATEGEKLKRIAGPDLNETVRLANMVQARFSPAFNEKTNEEFGFHSAEALLALANIGRMIEYRSKGKSK